MTNSAAPAPTLRPSQVQVNVSSYRAANFGALPRGRGGWCFSIGSRDGVPVCAPTGSYGDAKRWAQQQAAAAGASIVYLLS